MTVLRRAAGAIALAAAVWWLARALAALLWPSRIILHGVAPWGDHYGVRITPLSPAERAAAMALERELGGLTWGSNI